MGFIVYDPITIPNDVLTNTYVSICPNSIAITKTGNAYNNDIIFSVVCRYNYWVNKTVKDNGESYYTSASATISTNDTSDLYTKLYTHLKTLFTTTLDA